MIGDQMIEKNEKSCDLKEFILFGLACFAIGVIITFALMYTLNQANYSNEDDLVILYNPGRIPVIWNNISDKQQYDYVIIGDYLDSTYIQGTLRVNSTTGKIQYLKFGTPLDDLNLTVQFPKSYFTNISSNLMFKGNMSDMGGPFGKK